MKYKDVILQISVPTGKYCSKGGELPCENLDVDGFGTGCGLGMGRPEEDRNGWELKPEKCLKLKNVSQ